VGKKSSTPGVEVRAGSIRIVFTWNGQRCKPSLGVRATDETIKYATQLRTTIVNAIAIGKFTLEDYQRYFPASPSPRKIKVMQRNAPTVPNLLHEWMALQTLKPSTAKSFRAAINAWTAAWPTKAVADLTTIDIRTVIRQWQSAGTFVKTIRNYLIPLRGTLNHALEKDLIDTNPLDRIRDIKPDESELIKRVAKGDEIRPFKLDEIAKILKAANDPEIKDFIEFWLFTGLRVGELFGLAWESVNLTRGTVHVCRAMTGGVLGTPKANRRSQRSISRSMRTLQLHPRALAVLRRQKARTFMQAPVDCGAHGKLRFVFLHPRKGTPWRDDQEFRLGYWEAILRRAEIDYRRPYQLRHTFASMCLSFGEPEEWIAEQMGHVDVGMIRRTYGRFMKDYADAAGRSTGQKFHSMFNDEGIM
jgi:integrase